MKAKERMTAHQKMWVQPQIIFSFFILTGYINFLGLELTLRSTQMFNYNSTYYLRYCKIISFAGPGTSMRHFLRGIGLAAST